MSQKIKNALVSLSDKAGIEKLLKVLKKYKVNIISSGGTYKKIKEEEEKARTGSTQLKRARGNTRLNMLGTSEGLLD